jgi:hypothetical protein
MLNLCYAQNLGDGKIPTPAPRPAPAGSVSEVAHTRREAKGSARKLVTERASERKGF